VSVLNFTLTLKEELYAELIAATQDCQCSPKEFAAQCVEVVLAGRRSEKVECSPLGPRRI
jgi:hypothetical protein